MNHSAKNSSFRDFFHIYSFLILFRRLYFLILCICKKLLIFHFSFPRTLKTMQTPSFSFKTLITSGTLKQKLRNTFILHVSWNKVSPRLCLILSNRIWFLWRYFKSTEQIQVQLINLPLCFIWLQVRYRCY